MGFQQNTHDQNIHGGQSGLQQTIRQEDFEVCPVCGDLGPCITWESRDQATDELLSADKRCVTCHQKAMNIKSTAGK